jgi:fatty-acyl-CoA synthase
MAPVPGSPDYPLHTELTIGEYFKKQVAVDPDHEFIVYPDRQLRWTYKDFDIRTDNLAKGLLAIGMKPGDHLGVWARNVPDWITFMFATAKLGIVLVTMNPAYKSHELDYVLKQSDMTTLCIIDAWRDVDYIKIIRELIPEAESCERGHLTTPEFPYLKNLVYMGPEKHRGFFTVPELLLLGSHMSDEGLIEAAKTFDNNSAVNMQYTSGTTGFPKGVMLTHRNVLNNGFYNGDNQELTEKDRVCLPVPFYHCFGCVLGIQAVLTHRATMVIVEEYDPLMVLEAIHKERVTAIYGVPTMFIGELAHPMFDQFDLTSLRTGIIAGAAAPPEVIVQIMERMGANQLTNSYGLTETSPVMLQTNVHDDINYKQHTIGRHHKPVEVRIIDPTDGRTCAPGEKGEICCRGYNIMKGYYKMPEATAAIIDAEGFLHSGDLGSMDEDGFVSITGRIKDMIIRGGENIYPLEIENFMLKMPGVLDAQVVGAPDEKYGEIVVAFVRQLEGFSLSEEGLRETMIKQMARFKVPKYIFFVDQFPLTPSGKVKKFELRDTASELIEQRLAQ